MSAPAWLVYLLPVLLGLVGGGVAGVFAAWWFTKRPASSESRQASEAADPFVEAQIDMAAVRWAEERNQPEAAGLMAERLKTLHRIGKRKGWIQ